MSSATTFRRRFPVGAELHESTAHFRVWAPDHDTVHLVIEGRQQDGELPMQAEAGGYFSVSVERANAGLRYRYRPGVSTQAFPDPVSRAQPEGPHGPSALVDPDRYPWRDQAWQGPSLDAAVIYEMHIGTFTEEGTWAAAAVELPALADLGVTIVEMMPIAEFPGRFGWGYDGVGLYAPTRLYGAPDDLRRFIDRAHGLGLAVILDVVYNHVGPDGNYLREFSRRYFSSRHASEWGDAINFDDEAGPVREFITANAAYWIGEYHFDGLRLDATQQIFDQSAVNILTEIGAAVRRAGRGRRTFVAAENEPQDTRLVRPVGDGGYGLDALWNDDFHHTASVAMTGRREAYCTDYLGTPQEFISLAKWGFLYQGQRYSWQKQRRGTPTFGLGPHQQITFLQNHDQIANAMSGDGRRLSQQAHPALARAFTAYWLLCPSMPLFFQGQEFGATTPFLYFADHHGELAEAVRRGRAEFMAQFASLAERDLATALPDPGDIDTFRRCRLRRDERDANTAVIAFHRDLLTLRRTDRVFGGDAFLEGAVVGPHAFVLRYFGRDPRASSPSAGDERLVIVNYGVDQLLTSAPEPLLAPPRDHRWQLRWSSEDTAYGGIGTPLIDDDAAGWRLPGCTTIVLQPVPR